MRGRAEGPKDSLVIIIIITVSHDSKDREDLGEYRKGLESCDTQAQDSRVRNPGVGVRTEEHRHLVP